MVPHHPKFGWMANPPYMIRLDTLPETERDSAQSLGLLFTTLHHYLECFQHALQLFDYAENELSKLLSPHPVLMQDQSARFMFAGWMHIAARDATMSLYHFSTVITEIIACLRYLPTLRPLIKHDVIRLSVKLFRTRFPHYLEMRHSIAHSGESASQNRRTLDAVRGISFRENLLDRKLTSSIGGRFLSSELSQKTLAYLEDIEARFYSAFRDAGFTNPVDFFLGDKGAPKLG